MFQTPPLVRVTRRRAALEKTADMEKTNNCCKLDTCEHTTQISAPPTTNLAAPPSSKASRRSSLSARKKQLELLAAMEKAKIDKELIDKKLAADIASLNLSRDGSSRGSSCASQAAIPQSDKVENWLCDACDVRTTCSQPVEATPSHVQQLAHALKEAFGDSRRSEDLPVFSGDPSEWLPFKSFYDESNKVHPYTERENAHRIRKSLRGEAKETVSSLLITNASATMLMDTLYLRYGRPDIIISNIVTELRNLPPLENSYHNQIANFAIKIRNSVAAAKVIDQYDYIRSPEMLSAILSKCPQALLSKWTDYVFTYNDYKKAKLELFAEFIHSEAMKVAEAGVTSIVTSSAAEQGRRPDWHNTQRTPHISLHQDSQRENKCYFCRTAVHNLPNCIKFKRAMRRDRWRFVRENRLCHKCLIARHNKDTCPAANCDVDDCGQQHHKLLHWPAPNPRPSAVATTSVEDVAIVAADADELATDQPLSESVTNTVCSSDVSAVCLKVVKVKLCGPKGAVTTYALLDDGATVSLVSSDIADLVGLKGQREVLRVRGAWSNNELVSTTEIVNCKIVSTENVTFTLRARKLQQLNLPLHKLLGNIINNFSHLCNIVPHSFDVNVKPKILIGQDNYDLIVPLKVISGRKFEPYATLTPLGWCVHGLMPSNCEVISDKCNLVSNLPRTSDVLCIYSDTNVDDDVILEQRRLQELVHNSFTLESIGVSSQPRENKETLRALNILESTSELIDGNWYVGLPWKSNVKMCNSYPNAFNRLLGIERKMKKCPDFASEYRNRVKHLFENNYACLLSSDETGHCPRVWYLPHFGVNNINKKKLRLVFDAASKSNSFCLNDYLLQGPDLLQSLVGIMFRFRENRIGVSGDIKDMFLRIKIKDEDQHALRFLWRTQPEGPLQKCVMTSLIFGANCSPFIAQFIKNKNANRFAKCMPEAVTAITNNHYMDDYLDSFENTGIAKKTIHDVSHIHESGGFEMRNWTASEPQILSDFPKETLSESAVRLNFEKHELYERTLGLHWFPVFDTIGFNLSMCLISKQLLNGENVPTKRELLRIVMSIYDIYGLLAPFTIQARILLQETWKLKIKWDQKLNNDLFVSFKCWIRQLEPLNKLRIPRWYFYTLPEGSNLHNSELQLHVFCDASPSAYAAVAYWRLGNNNQCVDALSVSFIMSKSRVAPVKQETIPRLELQAAVLGCRIASFIKSEHRIKPSRTFLWSDSTTVLSWIRNTSTTNHKTFIANRLGEIDNLSDIEDWRYVPTNFNVADYATKRNNYSLNNDCEWFLGPAFLYRSCDEWPSGPETLHNTHENKNMENILTVQHDDLPVTSVDLPVPDPTRFSSWLRLRRCTAAVLLFVRKCRQKDIISINTDLMIKAEILLLRHAQLNSFSNEIIKLKQSKNIDQNSKIRTLTPFLDEDGLLRVGGRIGAVDSVSNEVKMPIVLDGRSHISRLIVQEYHERAAHSCNELVVNELRQKYWLLKLRPAVRAVAYKCVVCRIRKAKPSPARMGDLPSARMAHHKRAFTNCGVDLFGPIDITVGRRHEKRYGVLFACLTVRAIHIELVPSLTADSLIMSLRRMAARRGWPSSVYSDNGTNLKGADKELRKSLEDLDQEYLQHDCTNRGVDWHFISPVSPHMGGAWERLIRSVKTALKVVLKERAPREEVLITLLAEVENIINSRPITHVSVDPRSEEALSPNHFLLGSSSNLPVPGTFCDGDLHLRRHWRTAQRLTDMFWQRWVKEVLPLLLPRHKWYRDGQPVQKGDLVVIVDPNLPRNVWPMGVVEDVYPGKDKRVRVVQVRTKSGILTRPVTRVALLPTENSVVERDNTWGENVEDAPN